MAITLQTSQYCNDDFDQTPKEPDIVHMEHGWKSVASGLSMILMAHLLWFLGLMIAVGMIIYAYFLHLDPESSKEKVFTPDMFLFFGFMALGLCSLICFFWLLIGKWRCAVNASERNGAKWLMFGCIICMLLGPAISLTVTFMGGVSSHEIVVEDDGTILVELTSAGAVMKISGAVIGLCEVIFFVLFIRSIGSVFDNSLLKSLAEFYLLFWGLLLLFTLQMAFSAHKMEEFSPLLLIIPIGGLILSVWYLFMIFAARSTILNSFAKRRSPLEA